LIKARIVASLHIVYSREHWYYAANTILDYNYWRKGDLPRTSLPALVQPRDTSLRYWWRRPSWCGTWTPSRVHRTWAGTCSLPHCDWPVS